MRVVLLLLVLWPATGHAEPTPLTWPSHQRLAEHLSNVTLWSAIGLETLHTLRADDRRRAATCQGLRLGTAIGVTLAVKFLVHRDRPDHSNDHSFFSGHTANAMASSGWRVQVGVPLALGTGYFRLAAHKHYLSDVATGAAVGYLATRLCQKGAP